jgi:hypothetical protein
MEVTGRPATQCCSKAKQKLIKRTAEKPLDPLNAHLALFGEVAFHDGTVHVRMCALLRADYRVCVCGRTDMRVRGLRVGSKERGVVCQNTRGPGVVVA